MANFTTTIRNQNWLVVVVKEYFSSGGLGDQGAWWYAYDLHN